MLTIEQIKKELAQNEIDLKNALKAAAFSDIARLKTQRDELKSLLIEALEQQLTKVA